MRRGDPANIGALPSRGLQLAAKALTPSGWYWAQNARALRRNHGISLRAFDDARRAHLDLLPPWIDLRAGEIIDLGANVGDWTAKVLHAIPEARILAVEPDPATFGQLEARLGHDSRVRLVQAAVSDTRSRAKFNVAAGSEFGSLLEPTAVSLNVYAAGAPVEGRVEVDVVPLDELASQEISPLVKLDVQGLELAVLAGGRGTFSRAQAVLSEVNFRQFYEGGSTFGPLHSAMLDLGFVLWRFGQLAFLPDRGTLWGDACYVRDGDHSGCGRTSRAAQLPQRAG
jgi:FkbM family methyltransferase